MPLARTGRAPSSSRTSPRNADGIRGMVEATARGEVRRDVSGRRRATRGRHRGGPRRTSVDRDCRSPPRRATDSRMHGASCPTTHGIASESSSPRTRHDPRAPWVRRREVEVHHVDLDVGYELVRLADRVRGPRPGRAARTFAGRAVPRRRRRRAAVTASWRPTTSAAWRRRHRRRRHDGGRSRRPPRPSTAKVTRLGLRHRWRGSTAATPAAAGIVTASRRRPRRAAPAAVVPASPRAALVSRHDAHRRTARATSAKRRAGSSCISKDDEITLVRGDRDDVFSHGFLCPKGTALKHLEADPDRVRTPLVRDGDTFRERRGTKRSQAIDAGLTPIRERARQRRARACTSAIPSAHNLAGLVYNRVLLQAARTNERLLARARSTRCRSRCRPG